MSLITFLLGGAPKLIKANIKFNNDQVKVDFEILHPEFKEIEYVYLCLYQFAQMFFVGPKNFPEKKILLDGLSKIEKGPSPIESVSIIDNILQEDFDRIFGIREYQSLLRYKNIYSRSIFAKIPNRPIGVDSMRTITLMILEGFKRIDALERNILTCSLSYMSQQYIAGVNPRTSNTLIQLPIDSFQYGLRNRKIEY